RLVRIQTCVLLEDALTHGRRTTGFQRHDVVFELHQDGVVAGGNQVDTGSQLHRFLRSATAGTATSEAASLWGIREGQQLGRIGRIDAGCGDVHAEDAAATTFLFHDGGYQHAIDGLVVVVDTGHQHVAHEGVFHA